MDIKCPACGTENWLENQSRCFKCNAVLRRCADCANYDRRRQTCRTLDTDVDLHEAEHPSVLSISAKCPGFRRLVAAA